MAEKDKEIELIVKEIGFIPRDSITNLHLRVDRWGMRILEEIRINTVTTKERGNISHEYA